MSQDNLEADYQRTVADVGSTQFINGTGVEIIHGRPQQETPRHILFDFDGTLSLVREGWPEVMIPMMVEILQATGTDEPAQQLRDLVNEFVMQLTGKQTIYQMIRLAEEVKARGGVPQEPVAYKQIYHDRLMERITGRRESLISGKARPADMLVPYSIELLEALREKGTQLYVASGTDEPYVVEEAKLLGLDEYFGPRIYGARDDYKAFSKAMVIQRILSENKLDGASLVGFGDGYVEIQNIKEAGGTAVGVASDEAERSGKPDPWKRDRLIGVGADLIIPDFRDYRQLIEYLWNQTPEGGKP
jgi:phosphoglycolate phosphatase